MVRYLMYVDRDLRATTVRTLGTKYAATVSGCRTSQMKWNAMPEPFSRWHQLQAILSGSILLILWLALTMLVAL